MSRKSMKPRYRLLEVFSQSVEIGLLDGSQDLEQHVGWLAIDQERNAIRLFPAAC